MKKRRRCVVGWGDMIHHDTPADTTIAPSLAGAREVWCDGRMQYLQALLQGVPLKSAPHTFSKPFMRSDTLTFLLLFYFRSDT